MCNSHSQMKHGHGFGWMPGLFGFMDCGPRYESKETAVKRLEALKSHLEDRIKHIDERIAEIQNPVEGEEV